MDRQERRGGASALDLSSSGVLPEGESLRLALDAAEMGWWHWELTTGEIAGDARSKALLGQSPATETSYAQFLALVHPEDRSHLETEIARGVARPGDYQSEFRVVGPEGSVRWLLVKGRSIADEQGKPTRLIGVMQDITRRKTAEESLHRYELLANYGGDIVLFLRRNDGRILEANVAATQAYGYRREELLALSIHDLRAAEVQGQTADLMAQIDARDTLFETVHRRKDGSTFPVEVSSRSAVVGGTLTHVSVVRDITKRKQVEERLRQSETDLNRAQAVAQTGSWRMDMRQNQLHWSDETYRIFGIPLATPLTYEAFLAAVHPEDRDRVDQAWKASLAGRPYDVEHRIVVGDSVKWVREKAEPEFDHEGTLIGGFGTVQEITERKRTEEALRQAREELERRVAERTAALARANAELRALNTALEQRAELLQSLAARLTQAEERERRRLAKVLHDHLQQLLAAARIRLGSLRRRSRDESLLPIVQEIDDLLNQSIDESRTLTVELSPPVLYDRGLAAGLQWLAERTLEKYDLRVDVEAEPDAEPANENLRVFLFQAVRELLFNVVKHAQATEAHVRLTKTADQMLSVEVADDGVGCNVAAGDRGSSGGFGLFSIRERLELQGGRMEIQSRPGEGTRGIVVIPPSTPSRT